MDRLTEKDFNFDANFVASNLQSWPIAQGLKKLQAYEDSGLEPEEIPTVPEMEQYYSEMAELKRYRDAEAQGRLRESVDTKAPDPPYHLPVPPRVSPKAESAQAGDGGQMDANEPLTPRESYFRMISFERDSQDAKWGYPQKNTYCEWSSILAEEAGELAKELNELNFGRGNIDQMATEAIHVAAVALSILEQQEIADDITEAWSAYRPSVSYRMKRRI